MKIYKVGQWVKIWDSKQGSSIEVDIYNERRNKVE